VQINETVSTESQGHGIHRVHFKGKPTKWSIHLNTRSNGNNIRGGKVYGLHHDTRGHTGLTGSLSQIRHALTRALNKKK